MHRTRTLGGVVLIATGAVWIGQGTGVLGGQSFMVGDPFWAWLGVLGVVIGIGFIVVDQRNQPRAR
jgi:hypothetical protein